MKRVLAFCFFITCFQTLFSQVDNEGKVLQNILEEKNDEHRIRDLHNYFLLIQDKDPLQNLKTAQRLLQLAQRNSDKQAEAFAICQLGYQSFTVGNTTKSLEYCLEALKMSESFNNPELSSIIKNRIGHNYITEPAKQVTFYREALEDAFKTQDYTIQYIISGNLGRAFFRKHTLDSALFYLQQGEQLRLKTPGNDATVSFNNASIGNIYAEMNNPTLALAYFNLAIEDANKWGSARWTNEGYNAIAQFYHKAKQFDSATWYAKKAIEVVQGTPFSNLVLQPSKLLTAIYRNNNSDSAMKYAEMHTSANDSVNSLRSIQQNQLMTFAEELRQKKLTEEKQKIKEERKQNIQYALIALGIFVLLSLYLILSRSFITNTKLIKFFGVIALLIVFEFLNLLLHPFLERITHHSPVLMLLALVCIAALLVPLHHKLEKWATTKLVEKNKQIRLAAAKKTIEQLEENKQAN